jgi:hypothetical protein
VREFIDDDDKEISGRRALARVRPSEFNRLDFVFFAKCYPAINEERAPE